MNLFGVEMGGEVKLKQEEREINYSYYFVKGLSFFMFASNL